MSEVNNTNRDDRVRFITNRPIEFPQRADRYRMDRKKRTAIIFNHYSFMAEKFTSPVNDRPGTEHDVKQIVITMKKLHFNVTVHHDLKREELENEIHKLKDKDFSDEDCLAIFVLTHGDGHKLAARDSAYEIEELWRFFTGDKCPTLAGKPKLIFINACRGTNRDYGVEFGDASLMTDGPFTQDEEVFYKIPVMADILLMFSTAKGCKSTREPDGSWFIQQLCNNLCDEDIIKRELRDILTLTSRQVASMVNEKLNKCTQVPTTISTLIRDLYF